MPDEHKDQAKGQDVDNKDKGKVASKDPPRSVNAPPESGPQVHAQPSRADARTPHNPGKDQGREQFETAGHGIRAKPTDVRRDPRNMWEPPPYKAPTERRSVPAARDIPDINDAKADGSDPSAPIDGRTERRTKNGQDGDEEPL